MHRLEWSRRQALGALGASLTGSFGQAAAKAPAKARRDHLPAELAARLQASGLPLESFGLLVQTVDGARTVASWQAGTAFILASTAKIVTSLCALALLGPRYQWETRAFLAGPIHRGSLQGDLRIVGGGDPLLGDAQVGAWFARMRAQGLDRIGGDLVLDHGRFALTDRDFLTTPEPSPERPHHVRPDALVLNEGVYPSGQTVASAGVTRVGWLPARTNGPQTPSQALSALWRQQGGDLRGRALSVADDRPIPYTRQAWLTHRSQPLSALVQQMNKRSDNLIARHLMLSLSAGFPRVPATLDGAHQRMLAWLQQEGVAHGDIGVDSGSGLSRQERGTPGAMVQLLRRAHLAPHAQVFRDSLPIAGVDGTLEQRMRASPAHGRAWLKTGTLLDTRALAGYVQTRRGTQLAVALLANHDTLAAQATPALDACIEWLAASNV